MRYITSIALPVLIFCSISVAQESVSVSATGSFSVLGYTTVTRLADLNFGDLVVGVTTTVDPRDPQAAQFLFSGSSNTVVDVTITFPNKLTCGSNSMNFSELRPIYNTVPDAVTATEFKKKTGGSATTGADGNLYIWAGGSVRANANQAAGSYTGIIQIVVTQP